MCKLFNQLNLSYNLCQDVKFCPYNFRTVLYGTEAPKSGKSGI